MVACVIVTCVAIVSEIVGHRAVIVDEYQGLEVDRLGTSLVAVEDVDGALLGAIATQGAPAIGCNRLPQGSYL